MSSNRQSDARERLEQCPLCGEPYAAERFQVLLLGDLESFDCIECAMEELRRRRVMRRLKPELSTIESLTAELFAVKAQLESERRMSALEREEAMTSVHGLTSAPAPDLRIG